MRHGLRRRAGAVANDEQPSSGLPATLARKARKRTLASVQGETLACHEATPEEVERRLGGPPNGFVSPLTWEFVVAHPYLIAAALIAAAGGAAYGLGAAVWVATPQW
jgi:hypothetical protein